MSRRVAVTGRASPWSARGWAGLAAAVEATRAGHAVTLFEMAPHAGRPRPRRRLARRRLDNGQHICIGAYAETLRAAARRSASTETASSMRLPLTLVDADGRGLRLRAGRAAAPRSPGPSLRRARLVAGAIGSRCSGVAARWRRAAFVRCPATTVADLAAALPAAVRARLDRAARASPRSTRRPPRRAARCSCASSATR